MDAQDVSRLESTLDFLRPLLGPLWLEREDEQEVLHAATCCRAQGLSIAHYLAYLTARTTTIEIVRTLRGR